MKSIVHTITILLNNETVLRTQFLSAFKDSGIVINNCAKNSYAANKNIEHYSSSCCFRLLQQAILPTILFDEISLTFVYRP